MLKAIFTFIIGALASFSSIELARINVQDFYTFSAFAVGAVLMFYSLFLVEV